MKRTAASLLVSLALLAVPAGASAHVVVSPKRVGVGAFQTFTTSVPNERDVPVSALRLVIPSSVGKVTPTVKTGWVIATRKSGERVTEIGWQGGSIPKGQRDDFSFSAQAPANASTLQWKAYQTYTDGTVVSWDQKPSSGADADSDNETTGPYSTTAVVDDLTGTNNTKAAVTAPSQAGPYAVAGVALAVALIGLLDRRSK